MLTSLQAFQTGFLARCVEDNVAPERIPELAKEAAAILEKSAGFLDSAFNKIVDLGTGVAKGLAGYGIPLAIAAPPILGAAGGYGLAKATDIGDQDVSDIKNREVLDEYHRQTQHLLRQKAVRDYLKQKKRTGRVFI